MLRLAALRRVVGFAEQLQGRALSARNASRCQHRFAAALGASAMQLAHSPVAAHSTRAAARHHTCWRRAPSRPPAPPPCPARLRPAQVTARTIARHAPPQDRSDLSAQAADLPAVSPQQPLARRTLSTSAAAAAASSGLPAAWVELAKKELRGADPAEKLTWKTPEVRQQQQQQQQNTLPPPRSPLSAGYHGQAAVHTRRHRGHGCR